MLLLFSDSLTAVAVQLQVCMKMCQHKSWLVLLGQRAKVEGLDISSFTCLKVTD